MNFNLIVNDIIFLKVREQRDHKAIDSDLNQ
jgi:hypothetical protein